MKKINLRTNIAAVTNSYFINMTSIFDEIQTNIFEPLWIDFGYELWVNNKENSKDLLNNISETLLLKT